MTAGSLHVVQTGLHRTTRFAGDIRDPLCSPLLFGIFSLSASPENSRSEEVLAVWLIYPYPAVSRLAVLNN